MILRPENDVIMIFINNFHIKLSIYFFILYLATNKTINIKLYSIFPCWKYHIINFITNSSKDIYKKTFFKSLNLTNIILIKENME